MLLKIDVLLGIDSHGTPQTDGFLVESVSFLQIVQSAVEIPQRFLVLPFIFLNLFLQLSL